LSILKSCHQENQANQGPIFSTMIYWIKGFLDFTF